MCNCPNCGYEMECGDLECAMCDWREEDGDSPNQD